MSRLRLIGGILLVLLGLVWIGQGVNVLPGSFMSGQAMWAIIGVLVAAVGAWLVWSATRTNRSRASRS